MNDINVVIIMGNLTRDPEMRYLPNGTAVTNFAIASNREYENKDGEGKKDTCYLDITAWGRTAECVLEYLKKGSKVLVEGYLRYRTWETEDGGKRNKIDVVAKRVQFMSSTASSSEESEETGKSDDEIPF